MDKKRKFSKKALRDFELIDAAIKFNDQNAFAELMANYKKSIYFTILKMIKDPDDAEDLTIEAFSKAFNKLDKFKKDYTFSTWLFRIATNNTIDFIRKKKLKTTSLNTTFKDDSGKNIDIDVKDQDKTPGEEAIHKQKILLVRKFVSKLPDKYEKLIKYRYFQELSYNEIAEKRLRAWDARSTWAHGRTTWLALASSICPRLARAGCFERALLPDLVILLLDPARPDFSGTPRDLIFEPETVVFSRFLRAASVRRAKRPTSIKHWQERYETHFGAAARWSKTFKNRSANASDCDGRCEER